MIKIFKKIKDKIQKIREIRLNRKLKKLFPELPANDWVDKLDESEYNIKYVMNQKTLDRLKLIVSEGAFATYNVVSVPDNLLRDGEVMKVFSPKDKSEKTACGQLIYLQKRG